MDREMFITIVWPTLAKTIEDKGFTPCLLSNRAQNDVVYIEMMAPTEMVAPMDDCVLLSEKQFHDTVIDLLTRYRIPFADKSDRINTRILIYLTKLKLWEANND